MSLGENYSNLLQQATGGNSFDIDKDRLVVRGQKSLLWNHSYSPHDYAYGMLEGIHKRLATANDAQKQELGQILDKVWVEYRDLEAVNRQKIPKSKGFIDRVVVTASKFLHSSKQQHSLDDVRQLYGDIQERYLKNRMEAQPRERMGAKEGIVDAQQIDKHRNPAEHIVKVGRFIEELNKSEKTKPLANKLRALNVNDKSINEFLKGIEDSSLQKEVRQNLLYVSNNIIDYGGKNNVTACQNDIITTLPKEPPQNWDVFKNRNASDYEKDQAKSVVEGVEYKVQLRAITSQTVVSWLGNTATVDPNTIKEIAQKSGKNADDLLKGTVEELLKLPGAESVKETVVTQAKGKSRSFDDLKSISIKTQLEKVKDLKDDDNLKVVTAAHLKEIAARQAYRDALPPKIEAGRYNPGVIPAEIKRELGVGVFDPIPPAMQSIQDVKQELRNELERLSGNLTHEQVRYIRHDINELLDAYMKAYPGKSLSQAYVLGRDALRAIVYQEIHDKGSFTGSDHGSKHVHHNCSGADDIHDGIKKEDKTPKDRFLEHLIHMYHDMGYTVGLAATNFDCCKDHPFIGAKMIEENRTYFEGLLDKESFETFHDSVLCHAIAIPELEPGELKAGFHPGLVRSVTSISDACAVSYDRKTQEFWEQPGAILALTRLRVFVAQYPQYMSILSSPEILQDEWASGKLKQDDPLDKLAHDIFKGTKEQLLKLADNYKLAPNMEDRRILFRNAIENQFNAFTAKTTLGQYGAVLTGLEAVENNRGHFGDPKYVAKLHMNPSIVYGVLQDLFGQDQAAEAFKKVMEEFGVKFNQIQGAVDAAAKAKEGGESFKPEPIQTPNVHLEVGAHLDVESKVKESDKAARKHLKRLQAGLRNASNQIMGVYKSAAFDYQAQYNVVSTLDQIRKGISHDTFDNFINGLIAKTQPGKLGREQITLLRQLLSNRTIKQDLEICQKTEIAFRASFAQLVKDLKLTPKEVDDVAAAIDQLKAKGFVEKKKNAAGDAIEEGLLEPLFAKHLGERANNPKVKEFIQGCYAQKNMFIANEARFVRIRDIVGMTFMSDKAYKFILGGMGAPDRKAMIAHLEGKTIA